ncbi:MAG: FtsH protease activity modulator HflK [Candidatus Dasytiphilus stammeri]
MNIYQSYGKRIKTNRDPWGDNNPYEEDTDYNEKRSSSNIKKLFYLIVGNHNKSGRGFLIIILISMILWLISGFYTIQESDRGVVTRFGKFSNIVFPGLNWKLNFIDRVYPINIEAVREIVAAGRMLTSDENLVHVEMNVQYRVTNPVNYLFSVTNPDESLRQATDSALRGIIGKFSMDTIMTEGRTIIRRDTKNELQQIINQYNMGITLLDVNLQAIRPPEEVKAAFDDVIAARENEQQYIREAESYANEVQPRASGRAQRIIEDAYAYKTRTILEAQGEITQFAKILPEYKKAPEITKERLYIETMENIFLHTQKILLHSNSKNILFLPLKKFSNKLLKTHLSSSLRNNNKYTTSISSTNNYDKTSDMMNQRRVNAVRTPKEERK